MSSQIIADILMVLASVLIIILIILAIQIVIVFKEIGEAAKNVRNLTMLLEQPVIKSVIGIIHNFSKKVKHE